MGNNRSLKRRLRRANDAMETRAEPTKEAMKQYKGWQIAGLFFLGLVMLPLLLLRKALGRR
jgi:hypothetical protein